MVERIRTLLEFRQLTPTQFADAIGIARPIVSHILSGRNKPSLEVVQRILAAMPDLSMPWLLNGTGTMLATPVKMPVSPAPTSSIPEIQVVNDGAGPKTVFRQEQLASPPFKKPAPTPVEVQKPLHIPQIKRFAPGNQKQEAAAVAETAREALPQPKTTNPLPSPAPDILLPTEPVPVRERTEPASSVADEASVGSESPASSAVASALFAGAEKPIRRIVIFYWDGSFADYKPE